MRSRACFLVGLSLAGVLSSPVWADTFGNGVNSFEIEFVTIGDPGNDADDVVPNPFSDPLPSGSVNYTYRMAQYEISEEIIAKANALSDAAGGTNRGQVHISR